MAMLSSTNAASDAPQQQLAAVNAQDVQLICKELEVTKSIAEKTLREFGGNLKSALRHLISQQSSHLPIIYIYFYNDMLLSVI